MGAPIGNSNAVKKTKLLTDALKRELTQDPEKVRKIALKLIGLAEAGENWAMALIYDRVDGKAPQGVVMTGDEEGGPVRVEWPIPKTALDK